VVETIRKVVGVVSTYAGGALPEGAKNRVKGLVLALPERWAMANPGGGGGQEEEGPTISAAKAATGRVLSLAVEGLDMLSGCAAVFGESLERAEMYVGFLFSTTFHCRLAESFRSLTGGSNDFAFSVSNAPLHTPKPSNNSSSSR
jgi:hypothetical protein